MKKKISSTLFLMFICLSFFALDPVEMNWEVKANFNWNEFSKKKIALQVGHNASEFYNQDELGKLEGNSIVQITLIHSAFAEDPNFDQDKLNQQRIKELEKLIPNINDEKNIVWNTLALNSCSSKNCAENLWHGFVIEYTTKNPLHYTNIDIQSFTINSNQSISLTGKDGIVINIPANCFENLEGIAAQGEIEIQLREALNLETLFNGNLNTITDKKEILESGGSVEINAFSGNKELRLKSSKGITVKFPKIDGQGEMSLWDGEFENGKISWKSANQSNVMVYEETWIIEEKQMEDIAVFEDDSLITIFDLMFSDGTNARTDDRFRSINKKNSTTKTSVRKKMSNDNSMYNIFNTTKLGFINCDNPLFNGGAMTNEFEVICSNDSLVDYSMAYLIVPKRNAVIQLSKNYKTGNFILGRMRTDITFCVLLYGNKEEQEYSVLHQINRLKDNPKVEIELKEQSLAITQKELKELI